MTRYSNKSQKVMTSQLTFQLYINTVSITPITPKMAKNRNVLGPVASEFQSKITVGVTVVLKRGDF